MHETPSASDIWVRWPRLLWGLPNTLVGLAFAALSLAGPRYRHGLLVVESNRGLARLFLSRRGYSAITLGRVIISTNPLLPPVWVHELEHVAQSERWGPLFLPVYLFRHLRFGYQRNPFELEAQARADAYQAAHLPTPN